MLILPCAIIKIPGPTGEWNGKLSGILKPGLPGVPSEQNPVTLPAQSKQAILIARVSVPPSRLHCLIKGWLIRHQIDNSSPSLLPPEYPE